MEIDSFYEFAELAKRLNFTETARTLHMSQPTLSKHINALEKELRISLFDRSNSFLSLTQAGSAILPYAFKIIETHQDISEKIKEIKGAESPHLSIGGLVEETAVLTLLSRIVSELESKYGNSFLEIKNCRHKYPADLVKNCALDMVFDYLSEDEETDSSVNITMVAKCNFVALVSNDSPLAKKNSLSINDLKGKTLMKLEGNHAGDAWRFIEQACLFHGFAPKTKKTYFMKVTDLLAITPILEDGILILTDSTVQRMGSGFSPSCKQLPITGEKAYFPISVAYSVDNYNPILEEALKFMKFNVEDQQKPSIVC